VQDLAQNSRSFSHKFLAQILLLGAVSPLFSNSVSVGTFYPFKSKENPELAINIQTSVTGALSKAGIATRQAPAGKATDIISQIKTDLFIAGYYRITSSGQTVLYAQVYDAKRSRVIDASISPTDYIDVEGVEIPDEKKTPAEEVIAALSRQLVTQVKYNPRRIQRHGNLDRYLFSTAINELKFPTGEDLKESSGQVFELLAEQKVITASGTEESLIDAPASVVVITRREIKDRGYTSLDEVMQDLPGFDISITNGTSYLVAFQRGYRTPWTQRTLFLIDGKVENHLYTHFAEFSRQYPVSNIERIEVLYGPASVVYGANAFLGVINIVTLDGKQLADGATKADINLEAGSFNSRGADVTALGRQGDFSFAVTGKIFRSDEPDFSDRWGFISNFLLSDRNIWGPILDLENNNRQLGSYADPTDDYAVVLKMAYKNLSLEYSKWLRKEGYGPYYAADRAQPNSFWNLAAEKVYLEYQGQITKKLKSTTLLMYRESRIGGYWAEAAADTGFYYISYTSWNSDSNAWLLKQDFEFKASRKLNLLTGLKYERKDLTKAYDIPGYYQAYSSTTPSTDLGPHGQGAAIGKSTDTTYTKGAEPAANVPPDNRVLTEDIGVHILGILDLGPFRFNGGIRYDRNSVYKETINPRATLIYKYARKGAVKLLYGEAFQEPAPVQLYGAWTGRNANPDLKPEKVRNGEVALLYQWKFLLVQTTGFFARYSNVITEDAENLGKRDIYGNETRLNFRFGNFIPRSRRKITSYIYYTFTRAEGEYSFDQNLGKYQKRRAEVGDIAPHKVQFGMNFPFLKQFNANIRGNWISDRTLYTRNPIRTLDGYFVLNAALRASLWGGSLTLKVLNIFNEQYFHPGVEKADAGGDFSGGSKGFMNSVLPQPGRSFWFIFSLQL